MTNLSYTFIMLFQVYFSDNIKEVSFDESFNIIEKVFNHWRMTDILYSSFERMSEYESIESYLKLNSDNIKFLILDMTK